MSEHDPRDVEHRKVCKRCKEIYRKSFRGYGGFRAYADVPDLAMDEEPDDE